MTTRIQKFFRSTPVASAAITSKEATMARSHKMAVIGLSVIINAALSACVVPDEGANGGGDQIIEGDEPITVGDGDVVVNVTGSGDCTLDVAPSTVNFGQIELGATFDEAFNVAYNCADELAPATLDVTLTVTGSGASVYTLDMSSFTLAQGSDETVWATFAPTALGQAVATVRVEIVSGSTTVALTGVGIEPGCVPVAEIPYDGIDQDCDGKDLVDVDEDGFDGIDSNGDGVVDDCDDTDKTVYPGAPEIPNDGIDQDCDGSDLIDHDADNDGHDGDAWGGDDCDDADPLTYPGAPESCDGKDNDCDGQIDEGTECFDDDGDGFDENGGDCDDANPNVHPNVLEAQSDGLGVTGVDDDCDGVVDEACLSHQTMELSGSGLWYDDLDTLHDEGWDGVDWNDVGCYPDPVNGYGDEIGVSLWSNVSEADCTQAQANLEAFILAGDVWWAVSDGSMLHTVNVTTPAWVDTDGVCYMFLAPY
jgi:hypothetical protein